ncbi:hypothetical protein ABTU92_28835, partial [Rhodoplanes sp. SY1]
MDGHGACVLRHSVTRRERGQWCHRIPCPYIVGMCNLYSLNKGQAAILAFARAMRDQTGNLPIYLSGDTT